MHSPAITNYAQLTVLPNTSNAEVYWLHVPHYGDPGLLALLIKQNQQNMKKYFYSDGANNFGPFTLDELKEKNITRETKIWFQGLVDWKPAGTISELSEVFKLVPPPITTPKSNFGSSESPNNQKPPKTWLIESILVTLFCCLPFGIAGIVNASKVESRFDVGDIDGAKRASKTAKKWTAISFWLGLSIGIIYFLIGILSS